MEVWLTFHMFGEKIEKIADCSSIDDAMNKIMGWKQNNIDNNLYKIEKYDRIIYGKEKGIAVDFGDYSYFMLILSKYE